MNIYNYITSGDIFILLVATVCSIAAVGWVAIESGKYIISLIKNKL